MICNTLNVTFFWGVLPLLNIALNCVPLKTGKLGTTLFFHENFSFSTQKTGKAPFWVFLGRDSCADFCSFLCATTPILSEEQR